jgi:hypothetical protein
MAQHIRSSKLETRSSRLRLTPRKKPYFVSIAKGLSLGYRRTMVAGTWVVRSTAGGDDWTERIGIADDHEEAGVGDVLTYWQAQDKAREHARVGKATGENTVGAAIDAYEADLRTRGGSLTNSARLRSATSQSLRSKMVGRLTVAELKSFRDALAEKMKAASVNRICVAFKACLNLAAKTDDRITNRKAWADGLEAIHDPNVEPRNVILNETQVRAIIRSCYSVSVELGEFAEVAAVTGARPVQLERLIAEDLQRGKSPRLMMPSSKKGRKKVIRRIAVPITVGLAQRLTGRTGPLLPQPWNVRIRGLRFADAVRDAGLDPAVVTLYALRHSSIVRHLLAGTPIRVVAVLHDTSVPMIEKAYSRFIADHSDEIARRALLETSGTVHRFPSKEAAS